jgi:hypothetical protein
MEKKNNKYEQTLQQETELLLQQMEIFKE